MSSWSWVRYLVVVGVYRRETRGARLRFWVVGVELVVSLVGDVIISGRTVNTNNSSLNFLKILKAKWVLDLNNGSGSIKTRKSLAASRNKPGMVMVKLLTIGFSGNE